MHGVLLGLSAAHGARSETGEPLGLIHRDVSPDNVLVGVDGFARLLDFGVARALGQYHVTRKGQVQGKLAYLAPEQALGEPLDARTDVYMATLVLWQALTGKKPIEGEHEAEFIYKVLHEDLPAPSHFAPKLPAGLDRIVMRGLERDPEQRWPSAAEMAEALEAEALASYAEVGRWVADTASCWLSARAAQVTAVETAPHITSNPVSSSVAVGQVEDAAASLAADTPAGGTERPEQTDAGVGQVLTKSWRPVALAALVVAAGATSIALWVGREGPESSAKTASTGSAVEVSVAPPARTAPANQLGKLPPIATSSSRTASSSPPPPVPALSAVAHTPRAARASAAGKPNPHSAGEPSSTRPSSAVAAAASSPGSPPGSAAPASGEIPASLFTRED